MTKRDDEFQAFKSKGFHRTSNTLLTTLRKKRTNYKKFSCSRRRGSAKFSNLDFFGKKQNIYLYDADMPYLIKAHLTKLYEEQNPNPSPAMNRVFHHLLNSNNL